MLTIEVTDREAQLLLSAIRFYQQKVVNARVDLSVEAKEEANVLIESARQKLCKSMGEHVAQFIIAHL